MKKLVIYSPSVSDFAIRYIRAARTLGFESVVMLCQDAGVEIPASSDVEMRVFAGLNREPADHVAMFREDASVAGIVPGGEFAVEATEYIARELNLTRGMLGDGAVLRNKHVMRLAFARAGVAQPRLLGVIGTADEARALAASITAFPVVSKPVDAAGSWHVFRSNTTDELLAHMAPVFEYTSSRLTGLTFAGNCLVEEFIEGDEYSAEVIVEAGMVINCFLNRKFVSDPPHFDEIGHLCGVALAESAARELRDNIKRIVTAARVYSSVLHVEFKLTPANRVVIIEVACRIAGDYIAALVELQYGVSLEQCMVALRTGGSVPSPRRGEPGRYGVRFLFHEVAPLALQKAHLIGQHLYPHRPLRKEFSATHLTNRTGHEFLHQTG